MHKILTCHSECSEESLDPLYEDYNVLLNSTNKEALYEDHNVLLNSTNKEALYEDHNVLLNSTNKEAPYEDHNVLLNSTNKEAPYGDYNVLSRKLRRCLKDDIAETHGQIMEKPIMQILTSQHLKQEIPAT